MQKNIKNRSSKCYVLKIHFRKQWIFKYFLPLDFLLTACFPSQNTSFLLFVFTKPRLKPIFYRPNHLSPEKTTDKALIHLFLRNLKANLLRPKMLLLPILLKKEKFNRQYKQRHITQTANQRPATFLAVSFNLLRLIIKLINFIIV